MSRAAKTIYQVNARFWLRERRLASGVASMTLGDVEDAVAADWAESGYNAVWLLGVWAPSPESRKIARSIESLVQEARKTLDRPTTEDVDASPFALVGYTLDPALGDESDLARFRETLARHGLRLVLDFVPNHTALDHPWVARSPAFYIPGTPDRAKRDPGAWFVPAGAARKTALAHGRDPHFPPWTDTAQLNILHEGARRALIGELLRLADLCDGVRCDMAGLLLDGVFRSTWGEAAPEAIAAPARPEFWAEAIEAVKKHRSDFLLIAEGYGEHVGPLVEVGFDQVYDKQLLDELLDGVGQDAILAIAARGDGAFHLLHFTENHDETRAAEAFGPTRSMAAALVVTTLPGMALIQEGQREGWRIRPPVQWRRRPLEKPNRRLERFYARLLKAIDNEVFRSGSFLPLSLHPVEEHLAVAPGLIAYLREKDDERRIVIANAGRGRGRAHAPLPPHWTPEGVPMLRLLDELSGATESISMDYVRSKGFLVDLSMGGHRLWKVLPP